MHAPREVLRGSAGAIPGLTKRNVAVDDSINPAATL